MANIKSTLAKQLANAFGKSVSPKNADKAADAIAAVRQRNTKNPVADLEDTKKIADLDTAENLIGSDDALKEWKKLNTLPESQRQSNIPEAQKAAENLYEGRITSKEARKRIKENFPEPELYTAETMPEMPSVTDTVGAMGKKAKRLGIIKVKGFDLKSGERVGARLDIPAYNQYDKWVVSIHEGNSIQGKVKGYGQAIRLKNIEFGSKPKAALDIAKGGNKATIARIFGDYIPEDPYELQQLAKKILQEENSEWTQVGMNPYRGSYFYDKVTGNPVTKADEIIQVGPLVLAKNVQGLGQKVKPALSEMKKLFGPSAARTKDGKVRIFNAGGMVKQMGMFEGGGLSDETTKSNLAAAKKMYPILEGLEYDIVETPDEEGPYALEHFSPGEKGSVKSPRPDGIPLDRYGLHVFKTTKPEDIAGDIISHRLVNDDPYLSKKYKEFKEVTSPEVMERRYEFHQKNLGEERAYDLWAETTGFPELLRGHVFNQFPEEAKDSLYTDEQKRILEDIKTRVTQPKEFNKGGMAVVKDELATYLDRLAPKNKDFLAKLYADKSPKEREAILGGMLLGDTEFQASVAPYLPEGIEVDATRARLQRLPESMRKDGLNYKGLVVSKRGNPKATGPAPETTKFFKAGENGVPDAYFEYGTANAIGAVNATPLVYSHELRHLLNLDGSSEKPSITKDGMDYGETINRVQDVYAARTKSELGETILTLVNSLIKTRDANGQRPAGYADVQNRALNAVNNPANHTEDSLVELRDDILALPHIANVIEEYPQTMDKAVIGRYSKTPWHEKNITRPIGNLFKTPKEFNKGGTTMSMTKQMEMFEDGGLSDEGGTIDEMSGNDVPTGSLKEEVRDDIPAQLSEGEFVLPADVVRYHGLDKIMRLRDEAKAGIARMEAMGQMGNSEEAVLPDDVPFSLDDLEIDEEEVTNDTLEMNVGGLVPQQQPYGVSSTQVGTPNYATRHISICLLPLLIIQQQFVQPSTVQPPQITTAPVQPVVPTYTQSLPEQRQYNFTELMPRTVDMETKNALGRTTAGNIDYSGSLYSGTGLGNEKKGSSVVGGLAKIAAVGYGLQKLGVDNFIGKGVETGIAKAGTFLKGLGGANAANAAKRRVSGFQSNYFFSK
jgi:hypothetical protein